MSRIEVGQEVTWGRYEDERKTGKVIAIVNANTNIFRYLHKETGETQLKCLTQSRIKFGSHYSQNTRYLVAVQRKNSTVIDYYGPTVGMVESYMNRKRGVE